MRIWITLVILLLLSSCAMTTSTQDLVKGQSLYDHNCNVNHLVVMPTEAIAGATLKGHETAFSVMCQEENRQWKAIYRCAGNNWFNPTTCKEIEYKNK